VNQLPKSPVRGVQLFFWLFFGEELLANERRYPCSNQLSQDEAWHIIGILGQRSCVSDKLI
jgi:hypothetical protein